MEASFDQVARPTPPGAPPKGRQGAAHRPRARGLARTAGLIALAGLVALAGALPASAAKGPAAPNPPAVKPVKPPKPAPPPPPPGSAVVIASGLSIPAGQVWMGTHLWVSDHLLGFCRIDGAAINPGTCSTVAKKAGQPSYDPATNAVYLPDFSSKSQGVWRLTFDPATETVGGAALLATGLGVQRPSATALGPDGSLYVGTLKSATISRVATPGAATQSVQTAATAAAGIVGMAFAGTDLYLVDTLAVTKVDTLTGRVSPAGITAVAPTAIASDGTHLFVADTPGAVVPPGAAAAPGGPSDILRFTLATKTQILLSSGVVTFDAKLRPRTAPFQNVSGLAVDAAGNLYVADDPDAAAAAPPAVPRGQMYKIGPVP